jgi:DNA relaxase NicK
MAQLPGQLQGWIIFVLIDLGLQTSHHWKQQAIKFYLKKIHVLHNKQFKKGPIYYSVRNETQLIQLWLAGAHLINLNCYTTGFARD